MTAAAPAPCAPRPPPPPRPTAAPATPALVVRALVAGYTSGVDILRGASLEVGRGEIVTVLGPNGAGKSTLIKAIAGLVPVRSGEVLLFGQSLLGAAAHRMVGRGLAYVPQTDNVFARLSVRENLELGACARRDRDGFLAAARDTILGLLELQLVDQRREALAVFGEVDRVGRGAEDGHAGLLERMAELERGLPTELHDHAQKLAARRLDPADLEHVLGGQRLEIEAVGGVVVGGDRLRIAVDHDGLVAGILQ